VIANDGGVLGILKPANHHQITPAPSLTDKARVSRSALALACVSELSL
jgi:hypothetical protein